ncbi:uncharacterized protein LOC126901593 [Daktulosphaira vitifoliae]|uniref:uncharacterized protein LOC126901593 n=1 Tax=Daktulosphaira vitifoliae TaxID=58002 RepID=UPI0021AA510D|nr:uncharacterized protein LOC126901593 [Daktulosphaira vitifoliae]
MNHQIIRLIIISLVLLVKSTLLDGKNKHMVKRVYDLIYEKLPTKVLDHYNTLELDSVGSFKFTNEELNYLLKSYKKQPNYEEEKFKAEIKYQLKGQSLQCVNGIIVYYLLNELKLEYTENNQHKLNKTSTLIYFKNVLMKMIAVLGSSKIIAHNWFWKVYIQILAANNWPYMFFQNFTIDFNQYEDDLMDFIDLCRQHKYLPLVSGVQVSHSTLFYDSLGISAMKHFIKEFYHDGNIENEYLEIIYETGLHYNLDNIVLVDYFHREGHLFGLSEKYNFNWGNFKQRLFAKKKILHKIYRSMKWANNPFKFIDYQRNIVTTVKVNIFYSLWLQLKLCHVASVIYKKNVNVLYKKNTIFNIVFKILSLNQLLSLISFFSIDDPILIEVYLLLKNNISLKMFDEKIIMDLELICERLKQAIMEDINNLEIMEKNYSINFFNNVVDTVLSQNIKNTADILNYLIKLDIIDDIFIIKVELDFKQSNEISVIVKKVLEIFIEISTYIKTINQMMSPFSFFFINYFCEGAFQLDKTFISP